MRPYKWRHTVLLPSGEHEVTSALSSLGGGLAHLGWHSDGGHTTLKYSAGSFGRGFDVHSTNWPPSIPEGLPEAMRELWEPLQAEAREHQAAEARAMREIADRAFRDAQEREEAKVRMQQEAEDRREAEREARIAKMVLSMIREQESKP